MTITSLLLTTIAISGLFSASAAAANNNELSCSVNITSDIIFADNQLTLSSTTDQSILFTANGDVLVDGKNIALSTSEKKLAKEYFTEVEATIPLVVDITVDALEVTELALSEVFKGILGPNSKVPVALTARINNLAASVKNHVYQNPDSLTFNSAQLKKEIGVGSELDQEIEQIKAEVVSSVMGQLIVAVGQSMMSGGGNFAELESRMANLAKNIETQAQALGDSIAKKSDGLCDTVESLDVKETQLSKIEALRHLNTIEFTKKA